MTDDLSPSCLLRALQETYRRGSGYSRLCLGLNGTEPPKAHLFGSEWGSDM